MKNNIDKNWVFVEDALESIKEASRVQNAVSDFVDSDSDFMKSAYNVEGYLVDALVILIDDKEGWLEWFVYENDFGRKALKAGPENDMKPIKTLNDLKVLIELEA